MMYIVVWVYSFSDLQYSHLLLGTSPSSHPSLLIPRPPPTPQSDSLTVTFLSQILSFRSHTYSSIRCSGLNISRYFSTPYFYRYCSTPQRTHTPDSFHYVTCIPSISFPGILVSIIQSQCFAHLCYFFNFLDMLYLYITV